LSLSQRLLAPCPAPPAVPLRMKWPAAHPACRAERRHPSQTCIPAAE